MNDTLFKEVVGQSAAKRKLNFFVEGYQATRVVPNMIFVAGKGQGKTTLARETAKGLLLFGEDGKPVLKDDGTAKRKSFVEVNCSSLKTVKQFINGLVIPHIQDKDVTVLFDEASEIPHHISMALLTILNPNPANQTQFSMEEYVCDFDFRRQSFLFATSEPNQVFHALLDRLERIDLEEYTNEELAGILRKGVPDVAFEDGLDQEVTSVLRGNARAAQKMAGKIASFLRNSKVFMREDWKSLKAILGIYPLGLSPIEINVLKLLASHPAGTSLTALAARSGMSRTSLQQDVESQLLKNDLLRIETTGRFITEKGLHYLKDFDSLDCVSVCNTVQNA